jgi:hypothetical protein
MGQATLDLPDPLNEPDAPRQQSADDLLSQLAAEQIDQLLSDSRHPQDLGPPPGEASEAGTDPFAPPADVKDAAKEALTAEAAVAAQLDDLFQQINEPASDVSKTDVESTSGAAPAKPQAALSTTAAEVDAALASGTGPLLPPLEPDAIEEQTVKNERAALDASVEAVAAVGAEIDAQQETEADELPIYLRPLEWINAPLDHCPSAVREAFGKIAILTLFNSLAVLLYVLIFRRHH